MGTRRRGKDIKAATKELRANASEWVYAYEMTTSRLKTLTDPKAQVKTYSYLLDDNLQESAIRIAVRDTNVSFTCRTAFNRWRR
jgi:hypothetical protein